MVYDEYRGLTVYKMLKKASERFGRKIAISYWKNDKVNEVSYIQFFEDCRRVAAGFEEKGLYGKPVVIDERNEYSQVVALFAASMIGAIAAPMNFDLRTEDIASAMERIRPAMLIYDAVEDEKIDAVLARPDMMVMCTNSSGNTDSVESLLDGRGPLYEENHVISAHDPALLLQTSGSTGTSKLVLLTHSTYLSHIKMVSERTLMLFPLYHMAGFVFFCYPLLAGVPVCLSSYSNALNDMEWFHPAEITAVPAFLRVLSHQVKTGNRDISCLKQVINAAAPPDSAATEALESMGIHTLNVWGATEAGSAFNNVNYSPEHKGSIGCILPNADFRVDTNGELLLQTDCVMLGYLGNPEATEEVLHDGWYHTGDAGFIDKDGYVYITGRIRNIIILSNGENVSPEALEQQLGACPAIDEVIVRGKDDIIEAHVYCTDPDDSRYEQISAFIRKYNRNVVSYHRIRRIVFHCVPFERTATGKLKRTGLDWAESITHMEDL